ncbi:MAG TPA: hypothetical protein VIV14_04445 [Gammaproteobacteria bacterium]
MDLFAREARSEWTFAWLRGTDPLDDSLAIEVPSDSEPDLDSFAFNRFAIAGETTRLALLPRQPDRAFVVRPELPLSLPSGDFVRLFVSTPVWVSISLVELGRDDLFETPSFRPSDTWFGRDTLEGELCYASKTFARTDLSAMGARPHRAVTPVEIRNEGADTLSIEQLRVPVPALSLYQGEDNRLWTDTVSLVREEDETSAAMTVSAGGHEPLSGQKLIREPRKPIEPGTIITAFSQLLA